MKGETAEILALDDLVACLKAAKRTVYRLADRKKIPAFKVGGAWRFRRWGIDWRIERQTAAAADVPTRSQGKRKHSAA